MCRLPSKKFNDILNREKIVMTHYADFWSMATYGIVT